MVSRSRTDGHRKVDRLREDFYHEALAFSRHSINLELDEENMKPKKATKAPENTGVDPSKYHEKGHSRER